MTLLLWLGIGAGGEIPPPPLTGGLLLPTLVGISRSQLPLRVGVSQTRAPVLIGGGKK